MNCYYNPVHVIYGKGVIAEIKPLLEKLCPLGGKILSVVWNEKDAPLSFGLGDNFETRTVLYNKSNPTVDDLFSLYNDTADYLPDVIIAVGGGSVMDVSKSLCCLYRKKIASPDELRRVISEKDYAEPQTRWIGVPTTSGTGSEVTCWATIWDPAQNAKRSIEHPDNFAYAAVVDPDLTADMPIKLAVSSALDAMAHAIEGYWAKASNTISKTLALGAIKTIMTNLEDLIRGGEHAHEYMAKGSVTAGLAFSATKTTACHSLSYPLTMKYNIPHGVAVSMLLAPIMEINQESIGEYKSLLDALNAGSAKELGERVDDILRCVEIPCTLKEWGVHEADLPQLAPLCITKGRADNNPVNLTEEMVLSVLKSIYEKGEP